MSNNRLAWDRSEWIVPRDIGYSVTATLEVKINSRSKLEFMLCYVELPSLPL